LTVLQVHIIIKIETLRHRRRRHHLQIIINPIQTSAAIATISSRTDRTTTATTTPTTTCAADINSHNYYEMLANLWTSSYQHLTLFLIAKQKIAVIPKKFNKKNSTCTVH